MSIEKEYHEMGSVQDFKYVFDFSIAFMKTQAISVIAELKVADFLMNGPKGIHEIAEYTGSNADALSRLLRALASIGVFMQNDDGLFELTQMASVLLSNIPVSLHSFALISGHNAWWKAWGNLHYSVKTGKPAFDHEFGMDYIEYLQKHPDYTDVFNHCLTSASRVHNPAIIDCYNFSEFKIVIDVGGGQGSLLSSILEANQGLTGILFERSQVIQALNEKTVVLHNSMNTIEGDFFKSVPSSGDVYILKQIIHDWNDDLCIKILRNCHQAMGKEGRILVIEAVMEEDKTDEVTCFFDLHMLVTSDGGKERSVNEFEMLFNKANFELTRVIKTSTSFSIMEGIKKTM